MQTISILAIRGNKRAARYAPCLLLYALAALIASPLAAQDEVDPVTSAGESLREAKDLPWYDAKSDDIKPLPPEARDEPPPRPTSGTLVEPDDQNGEIRLRGSPEAIWYMVQMLGLLAIAALIIVIISFVINALLGRSTTTTGGSDLSRITQSQADRVEDLPVPLKRAQSDLLGEARRQYERGDYNEAIIYLYSHLLVELDKANRIRLVRGKTNRQYLAELRDSPALRAMVGETMIAFEDVYFGERTLTRERFESCWRQLDTFHSQLELAVA